jgi:hypothetical protein
MKIALLLKSKKQPKSNDIDRAVIFEVEKDKVTGVENAVLESTDVHALTFWAQTEKVGKIYTPYADDRLRLFFNRLGICLKGYDELSDDKLFRTFIFT